MEITEKEFAVIREISSNNKPTQRSISRKLGISLGLTNLIIKRLAKKGYIKIQKASCRTILYTLTPKGFAQKAKRSYQFSLKSINLIKTLKENIQDIIDREYKQGAKNFIIFGNGELATLVEIAFRDLNLKDTALVWDKNKSLKDNSQCNILVMKNDVKQKIDILSELSKKGVYY